MTSLPAVPSSLPETEVIPVCESIYPCRGAHLVDPAEPDGRLERTLAALLLVARHALAPLVSRRPLGEHRRVHGHHPSPLTRTKLLELLLCCGSTARVHHDMLREDKTRRSKSCEMPGDLGDIGTETANCHRKADL